MSESLGAVRGDMDTEGGGGCFRSGIGRTEGPRRGRLGRSIPSYSLSLLLKTSLSLKSLLLLL